jgi:hypothetical protein
MVRRFMHKRLYVALTAVAVLAIAGAAFAYFTSTGSGTGHGTVGTAGAWTVTQDTTSGTMYPGSGTSTIGYTVTNSGTGHQNLAGTTTVVAHDALGNVLSNGTAVSGCLAADFVPVNTSPAAIDLAYGLSTTGSVAVTMTNTGLSQNACQGVTPDITISAS